MEPASFAVGLVGLAGLFSSCLEVVNKVQSYKSFARDSSTLAVQFNAAKVRLENWGRAVGFSEGNICDQHHPALDDEKTRRETLEIFRLVRDNFDTAEARISRSLRSTSGVMGTGSEQPLTLSGILGKSKRRKLAWAMGDKSKITEQVELLGKLVETLHDLVPPDPFRGTWVLHNVNTGASTVGLGAGSYMSNTWSTKSRQLNSHLEAKTRRDLHMWLRHISNERYEDSLQRHLKDTCCWILEQPTFIEWISPEFPASAKVLWMHGPAGFGKTILCATIVEHITRMLQTPVAHFFFSSDDDSREDPFLAVRSWISQVVTQHDGAFQSVLQYQETDTNPFATRHTIISLFQNLVRMVPGCTFVVDGLDECMHLEGRTNSVDNFLQTLKAAMAGTDTRVLIISRTLSIIQHALRSNDGVTLVEYKMKPDDVQSDIAAYSRDIVNGKLYNKDPILQLSLSKAMAERCEGQFLWLKLQGESLRRGMSKKQLEDAVRDTPTELNRIYDLNWTRITQLRESDKNRGFALLRWTAFATRPLTTCEITEAVHIDDNGELAWDYLPEDVDRDYVDTEILNLCSPLLEARSVGSASMPSQQTVHLPHFTIRQYLLCNLPVPGWLRLNESLQVSHAQLQHTVLARACLQYIKHSRVWQNAPSGSLEPFDAFFLTYAATSWHRHVNLGQRGNAEIIKLAVKFLTERSTITEAWRLLVESGDAGQHGAPAETRPPSPLYHSAKLQLTGVTAVLIQDKSCDVNEISSLGRSALSIACSNGTVDIVAILLSNGANASLADTGGMMPIHVAAQNGHAEVVRLLLEHQAHILALTAHTYTPTCPTEREVSANVFDVSMKTPLHHSVLHGQTSCIQLLLEHGAKLTGDIDNMTPLHYTVSKASEDMALCLLAAGVPIDSRVERRAWQPGYQEGKLHYIPSNSNIHASGVKTDNHPGLTALHYAALTGCQKMTKFFLERGADPNAVSEHGETPLHMALKRDLHGPRWPKFADHWNDPVHRVEDVLGYIDYNPEDEVEYSSTAAMIEEHRSAIVNLLLDQELTEVNVQDHHGASPLHNVIYESSAAPEIITRLIQKGANVSARNNQGQTPLHLACSKGNVDSVATMLAHGADITLSDSKGTNALHYAAQSGHGETIRHLIAHTAGVSSVAFLTSQDDSARNALHHLVSNTRGVVDCSVVRYLLDIGVNVNDVDDAGMSPLALYLENLFFLDENESRVVQLFLQRGSEPSFKTRNRRLGLAHLYANSTQVKPELLAVLGDYGVDLQAKDEDGRTVLHHCAIAGSLTEETLHFLCSEGGLAEDSQDAQGITPRQYATKMRKENHHPDLFDRERWSQIEKILLGSI